MTTAKLFGTTGAAIARAAVASAAGVSIGLFLSVASASAADMAAPAQLPAPAAEPMVEWGSGWYLRGDLGVSDDKRDPMMRMPGTITSADKGGTGLGGDIGFGYQFSSMFRSDVTAGIRRRSVQNLASSDNCQIGTNPVVANGVVTGTTPITDSCTATGRTGINRYPLLVNAYVDLGSFGGLHPYVGAGVGAAILRMKYNRHELRSDGMTTYDVNFTDQFTGQSVRMTNELNGTKSKTNFAYALMAGVGYDIADGLTLDVGYRYLNMGKVKVPGATTNAKLQEHEARVGLRYRID